MLLCIIVNVSDQTFFKENFRTAQKLKKRETKKLSPSFLGLYKFI